MGLLGADAWELAGFPGRLKVAAYLTAVPVEVTLRKRGAQSVKGRPAQVPNRREARRAASETARLQREAAEGAERAIAARSGTHLADWSPVAS